MQSDVVESTFPVFVYSIICCGMYVFCERVYDQTFCKVRFLWKCIRLDVLLNNWPISIPLQHITSATRKQTIRLCIYNIHDKLK